METTLSYPPLSTKQSRESTMRRVGLVMTYNQKETCIEAIDSLIAQTLALDLIIVSDDCSTDGTYEVITHYFSRNGKPNNVELYQSEKNLGFISHFNTLLESHCRDDDLIFYNAGDDISETSRVEEFYREYVTKGKPRHFLGHSYVTSFGSGTEEILVPPIESIKHNRELCLIASAYHIGASQVFTGALFSDFGPILFDDCYEDLTLGYRALLKNAYHFIPKALLRYRIGGLSSWQKNPLEKKRGRLKSTLTQRAVDSMRSGDFEALAVIQDCYSQYGFQLQPHKDQTRVIILYDQSLMLLRHRYSIANHFETINNVCTSTLINVKCSQDLISHLSEQNFSTKSIVWLLTPCLSTEGLHSIFSQSSKLKDLRVVLDIGTQSLPAHLNETLRTQTLINDFIKNFPEGEVHTSCADTAVKLNESKMFSNISYYPPLHYIDGPDPDRGENYAGRGLVIICDATTKSSNIVKSILRASEVGACGVSELTLLELASGVLTTKEIKGNASYPLVSSGQLHRDISEYDFLVIINGSAPEYFGTVQYWYSHGANACIPTFINSNGIRSNDFHQGKNIIFVDDEPLKWSAALHLLQSEPEALKRIARESRRLSYFKYSVQKNTSQISALIGRNSGKAVFFDKFLPL